MTDDQFKAEMADFKAQMVDFKAQMVDFKDQVLGRLDDIDGRLDELTAEVSLQRAALERFGFMGKAPKPPTSGGPSYTGGTGLPMAAKRADSP